MSKTQQTEVQFYRDRADRVRWRVVALENGDTLGDSGQGYRDRRDAEAGYNRIIRSGAAGGTTYNYEGLST